jgi:hypothetical protein
MKKLTNELQIVLEYEPSDIVCKDGEAYLERAELNGYGIQVSDEILEIANEDAMFTNQLYWEWKNEQDERAADAADYRYHSMVDAKWGAL